MKNNYTNAEVAELLAVYRNSDNGYCCIEEVQREWKNSFPAMKVNAGKWLIEIAYLTIPEKAKIWFDEREKFFQEQLLMKYDSVEEAYCETFNIRKL